MDRIKRNQMDRNNMIMVNRKLPHQTSVAHLLRFCKEIVVIRLNSYLRCTVNAFRSLSASLSQIKTDHKLHHGCLPILVKFIAESLFLLNFLHCPYFLRFGCSFCYNASTSLDSAATSATESRTTTSHLLDCPPRYFDQSSHHFLRVLLLF